MDDKDKDVAQTLIKMGETPKPSSSKSISVPMEVDKNAEETEPQPKPTKTACMACRGLKMRCIRSQPGDSCDRCARMARECVVPPYRKPGRQVGAKNKYKGVDRALRQIQSELKRVKGTSAEPEDVLSLLAAHDSMDSSEPGTSQLLSTILGARGLSLPKEPQLTSATNKLSIPVTESFSEPPNSFTPIMSLPTSTSENTTQNVNLDNLFLLNALEKNNKPLLTNYPHNPTTQSSNPFMPTPQIVFPPPTSAKANSTSAESTSSNGQRGHQPSTAISDPLGLLAEASQAVRPDPIAEGPALSYFNTDRIPTSPVTDLLVSGPLDTRINRLGVPTEVITEGLLGITADVSKVNSDGLDMEYFKPNYMGTRRGDLGPDYDPIDMALLTWEQVQVFFNVFFAHLHPLISVLDQTLHTPEFVRSRSAFLFTAICFNGAQFTDQAGEVAKRLQIHADRLAKLIVSKRYQSLEIGQGFLIWFPWLPPPARLTEDHTWFYTAYALSMAEELGLDRPLNSLPRDRLVATLGRDLDGLDSNDHHIVERMVRNRERFWLRFFIYESAAAVAFGRSSSVFLENDLIRNQDWHLHPLALPHDKETIAIKELRRYIISLSTEIRARMQSRAQDGTGWIKEYVDSRLDPWHKRWLSDGTVEAHSPLPTLYVTLVYSHMRLWCLSMGLHAKPAETDDSTPPRIVNDCLVSALESVQVAVSGLRSEKSYWKMPNTVFPLLTWAACLSIRLFDCDVGFDGFYASQASLLGLIASLALILEEVGTTPSHRSGTAAVYGRHLRVIVKSRILSVWRLHADGVEAAEHGEQLPSLAIPPGTVTPIFVEPGSGVPLANWPNDWWTSSETNVPWSEDMFALLGEGFGK